MDAKYILQSNYAYAIMPLGKGKWRHFHAGKERNPRPCCTTVEGFFFSFIVAKHPLGYSLSLSCLSSHLLMRWQTTPAATVTRKVTINSMQTPPPVAGYRLDNKSIISHCPVYFYIFSHFHQSPRCNHDTWLIACGNKYRCEQCLYISAKAAAYARKRA